MASASTSSVNVKEGPLFSPISKAKAIYTSINGGIKMASDSTQSASEPTRTSFSPSNRNNFKKRCGDG